MDSQLRWVLDLFNEHGLPYWVNSGTLLGLMREGKLLGHDQDIDISLWAGDEPALKKAVPLFKRAGYKLLVADYKGFKFQYNFSKAGGQGVRNIDVNLFRRCGAYAWCPEYYFKVTPRKAEGKRAAGAVRRIMRAGWRAFIARFSFPLSVTAWPWRSLVNFGTWWIPAAYFDRLVFRSDLNAYIPADWEGYLAFRYGNWRVPQPDWVFHRDDRGFFNAPPDALLSRAR